MQIIPIEPDQALVELLGRSALPTSDINQPGSIYFFGCHQKGELIWTSPGTHDTPQPQTEAISKASGLTPPIYPEMQRMV